MNVSIIAALTADGLIGRNAHHVADWTTPEDKRHFVQITKQAGAVVMGAKTFATIGRALPGRRTIVYTSRPETIRAEGVETTAEPAADLVARLASEGHEGLTVCGGAQIYSLFMEAGLVNELYLNVHPLLFGQGVGLFNGPLESELLLQAATPQPGGTVLLHYVVKAAAS